MKDFNLSLSNIDKLTEELKEELKKERNLIINSQPATTGKWGMAKLWRVWMSTTAKFMAGNGARMPLMIKSDGSWYGSRPFDENDAHELFTRQWLGVDGNGERLSWAKSGDKRLATKGERYNAMRKHENWCVEKGIALFKPRGCEYQKLEEQQDK